MWVWINLPLLSKIKGKMEKLFLGQSRLSELWIPYRKESSCTSCGRFSINDKSKKAPNNIFHEDVPELDAAEIKINGLFSLLVIV